MTCSLIVGIINHMGMTMRAGRRSTLGRARGKLGRRVVPAAVMTIAALLVLIGNIPATVSDQPEEGDRWIEEHSAVGLPDSTTAVIEGTPAGDACVFELSGEGSGDTVEVVRELSFDSRTCVQTVARVTYPADEIPAEVRDAINENTASEAESQTVTTSVVTDLPVLVDPTGLHLTATTYTKTLKAMVRDPLGLVTTSTQTTLTWRATASEVSAYSAVGRCTWLSGTGWRKSSCAAWTQRVSATAAYADTTGQFWNSTFCSLIFPPGSSDITTTYATHSQTRVEGRTNGGWAWSYSMVKAGGCNFMLHYDFIFS